MRSRLTNQEREIRSGAGIPIKRWLPFAAIYLWPFVTSLDTSMLERCAGRFADGSGRAGAWERVLLTYPCSPYLMRGSWAELLLFAALWLPIPFAILNLFWLKRHRAYWGRIQQREKERRTEKREHKSSGS